MSTTVGSLVDRLLERIPESWAEPWDRVGLMVGSAEIQLSTVLCALDADAAAVALARDSGAELLLTHHPPFLDVPSDLVGTSASSRLVLEAMGAGIALAALHTNLDRSPEGAEALAVALGLEPVDTLESGTRPTSILTVFCPVEAAERVTRAMSQAGAGSIGLYEGCSFSVEGSGRFTPQPGASPSLGGVGERTVRQEERVEMVCDPGLAGRVVAAAVSVHPYEEPLVLVTDGHMAPGSSRLGRVCDTGPCSSLADVARLVQTALGVAPKVWGDPSQTTTRAAVVGGSGSSLIGDAVSRECDVMVTGEVRYHDAKEALDAGLAVVEAGHDATERPLVAVLARLARESCADASVAVRTHEPHPPWWMPDRSRDESGQDVEGASAG